MIKTSKDSKEKETKKSARERENENEIMECIDGLNETRRLIEEQLVVVCVCVV